MNVSTDRSERSHPVLQYPHDPCFSLSHAAWAATEDMLPCPHFCRTEWAGERVSDSPKKKQNASQLYPIFLLSVASADTCPLYLGLVEGGERWEILFTQELRESLNSTGSFPSSITLGCAGSQSQHGSKPLSVAVYNLQFLGKQLWGTGEEWAWREVTKLFKSVALNILSPFFLHERNLRRIVMRLRGVEGGWGEGVRKKPHRPGTARRSVL